VCFSGSVLFGFHFRKIKKRVKEKKKFKHPGMFGKNSSYIFREEAKKKKK
jgi:hypothetical protein